MKLPIHAHHFTTSTYAPMECSKIGYVSPFPDRGYILVIVCSFTSWIELYHTLDATALSAAECLLKHIGRFGAPSQLRSDNGPLFIVNFIREFLLLVGVKHCLRKDTIVERYKKEINQHLRSLTYDNSCFIYYKKSLPFVYRISNSNQGNR